MLVNEYLIAVWVNDSQTRRTCCVFLRLSRELNTLLLQMTLNISDITEVIHILCIAIPARIECEDVFFKHALKEADYGVSILQYQPVLRLVAAEDAEPELLIEGSRGGNVFDRETHGEGSEFHGCSILG